MHYVISANLKQSDSPDFSFFPSELAVVRAGVSVFASAAAPMLVTTGFVVTIASGPTFGFFSVFGLFTTITPRRRLGRGTSKPPQSTEGAEAPEAPATPAANPLRDAELVDGMEGTSIHRGQIVLNVHEDAANGGSLYDITHIGLAPLEILGMLESLSHALKSCIGPLAWSGAMPAVYNPGESEPRED